VTLLDHEELPEVILDFAQVRDFVDYGVAVLTGALLSLKAEPARINERAAPQSRPSYEIPALPKEPPRTRQGTPAAPRRMTAKIKLMTASTSRMWTQAPIVDPDTRPRTQRTSRITVMVQSMLYLLCWKIGLVQSRSEHPDGPGAAGRRPAG
jgi:hypothetical protein